MWLSTNTTVPRYGLSPFAQPLNGSGTTGTLQASGARFSYHLTLTNYAQKQKTRHLRSGIAVASEDGTVVYQAPDGRETLVVCDVTLEKVGGSMLPRLSLIE